jgi:hypothetical protein
MVGCLTYPDLLSSYVYSKIADKIAENLVECLEELMGFS